MFVSTLAATPAGPRQSLLSRQLADRADKRGQTLAGHMAGRVAVRASRPRRLAQIGHHTVRLSARLGAQPSVAGVANRFDVQLGAASLRPR